ncbi:MAG: 50S ribosome-binding GTPase [Acidobacteria bacterium]|nr:50S ribosome-binding GTPase [Acidobacteriota bacterium]
MFFDKQKLIDAVKQKFIQEKEKPLTVSVMGQTGVGKSSLLNALFGTNLKTDDVRPCTKEIERVIFKGKDKTELWFYDMPGIGESSQTDPKYVEEYRKHLNDSDVVLWALHADSRSVAFDLESLRKILGENKEDQAKLISKITFILTKADLLTPSPWVLAKNDDYGIFATYNKTTELLVKKATYFQEMFVLPYADKIISQTYNDTGVELDEFPLFSDKHTIFYKGLLDDQNLRVLKNRFPALAAAFDRLHDNYQVIPCSSLFRFNLSQLLLVIINRLGQNAISRFSSFVSDELANRVLMSEAKKYCNIVVFDTVQQKLLFDMNKQNF